MESFFSRLKVESLFSQSFKNLEEAYSCVFEYIEMFYNSIRIHSANYYLSPIELEDEYQKKYGWICVYFFGVTPIMHANGVSNQGVWF